MHDKEAKRSAMLGNILGAKTEERPGKGHTSAGAGEQAFSLRVDFRNGRRKRGTAWSHYSDYQWNDLGDREVLEVIFGDRMLTIEGHNLGVLYRLIDKGKLESFVEELSARILQNRANPPEDEALVTSVQFYPDFEELKKQIKGEADDQTRFTRRLER